MRETDIFPIVVSGMVFASVSLFFAAVHFYFRYLAERKRLVDRIESDTMGLTLKEGGGGSATEPTGYLRFILYLFQRVGKFVKSDDKEVARGRRISFLKAGIRSEKAPFAFWGAKYVLGLLFPALFIVLTPIFLKPMKPSMALLLSIFIVMAGFYIPDVWLRLRISRRKEKIRDALPDALDLLVVCVEAGMGLDAAVHRVGEEIRNTSPVLSDEFRLFNLEVRAGKTKRDALKNLALRTDVEDVGSLVTLLIQTEKFGTSIAHSLRIYSDSFRTKRAQKAEEIAAKLPVKILMPLVLFIFPSIFIVIIGPGAIKIFRALVSTMAG